MYEFDIKYIIESFPYIVKGIGLTIFISVISSILAFTIALTIAFLRRTNVKPVTLLIGLFVELTRNTPLLIQLYIYYKGLPNIGLNLSPIACGIISLSLYTGVFISEVLRAGLNSIAHEQYQAARGLGLSDIQTFRLVTFPQALRIIIPPLGSQFINLIKNSSLVSFIAVTDLFYVIYKGAVDDFMFFEMFITGAIIYMALTGIVAFFTNLIEQKLKIPGKAGSI